MDLRRCGSLLVVGLFLLGSVGAAGDTPAETLHAEVLALRDVRVPAEVPGRMVQRPADESAKVKQGEVVVALDDVLMKAAARGAEANARRAKARRDWARTELERTRTLSKTKTLGQADLDQSILAAQEAEEALQAAEALAEEARERLARTRIRAPFDGRLVRIPAQIGEYLGVGQMAFRIVDDSQLKIVTYVSAGWLSRLKVGDTLTLQANFPGAKLPPLPARIFSIAPAAEGASRTFRVEARAERDEGGKWRPGMTAIAQPASGKQR